VFNFDYENTQKSFDLLSNEDACNMNKERSMLSLDINVADNE